MPASAVPAAPRPRDVPAYLATVLPGLEGVAADELRVKVPAARPRGTERGKVYFDCSASFDELTALRTIDNLYLLIGRCAVGPHRVDLAALRAAVARLDMGGVVAWVRRAESARLVTFWVNASRSGHHSYSRFEAAAAAAAGIQQQQPSWQQGTPEQHRLEFRLDVAGDQAQLSLRLTPPAFRFRGQERRFAHAALRPPVAHALVWLSQPQPDQVFLDPFCGSGTIVEERLAYPAQRVYGSDASEEALAAAGTNLPRDERLTLARWDARHLPLAGGSVDALATNLPFGRQVLSPGDIPALYGAALRELRRVVAPPGQAIVLTDQVDALHAAAARTHWHAETLLELSLKGLHPRVVRLR